jgi:hypothetical protein
MALPWIAGVLIELGREWVADWRAGRENQRQVEKAVTENRVRMAIDQQSHNQEWEMRALEGRDNWLRRASFVIWSTPIVWAAVDPVAAAAYFRDALGALPEWYVYGYLAVSGAIWGVVELKQAGILKGVK